MPKQNLGENEREKGMQGRYKRLWHHFFAAVSPRDFRPLCAGLYARGSRSRRIIQHIAYRWGRHSVLRQLHTVVPTFGWTTPLLVRFAKQIRQGCGDTECGRYYLSGKQAMRFARQNFHDESLICKWSTEQKNDCCQQPLVHTHDDGSPVVFVTSLHQSNRTLYISTARHI